MPSPARSVVTLLPIYSGPNDEDVVLYGTCRDYVITVRPDDEHVPEQNEDQRWVLIIDAPDPPGAPT